MRRGAPVSRRKGKGGGGPLFIFEAKGKSRLEAVVEINAMMDSGGMVWTSFFGNEE